MSIGDLWQYCVCCIRSGVIWCTLLMVLYLDRMCQCGSHAVFWSHIGTFMLLLAEELRSTAGLLFLSQCPSGTILLTPYSRVVDWRVSRARPMFFTCLCCSIPTIVFYSFSSSFWKEFVRCQVRANETYSEIKFSARNRDVLMNDQSPLKWWSTLKSAVFGLS